LQKKIEMSRQGANLLLPKLNHEPKLQDLSVLTPQKGFFMRNKGATFVALAAVMLTMGSLWFTNRAATPREATWDDVLAEARSGGYKIITTEQLAERYEKNRGDLLLVDTRQGWEYRTGHLEGALNFPMEPTWWSRWRNAEALKTLLGPDKNRFIVFY